LNPDLKDKYFNLGLVSHPRKNVDVALAYKYEKVDNGFVTTSNGSIGGCERRQVQRSWSLGPVVF